MTLKSANLVTCPFCISEVHESATICKECGAVRKRGASNWTSPRDQRRTDILLAVLAAWIVAAMVWALIVIAGGVGRSSSPPSTSCPPGIDYCLPRR